MPNLLVLNTSILILGGGISGTALSMALWKAGVPFLVVDAGHPGTASAASSGAILPMTGQRLAETVFWREALPVAQAFYHNAASALGKSFISETDAVFFHRTTDAADLFHRRAGERTDRMDADIGTANLPFHAPFGAGRVHPAYTIDTTGLIGMWGDFLGDAGVLRREKADYGALRITENGVQYEDITAERIIFCNGESAYDHPLWAALTWVRNKGEALLLHIPSLDRAAIYKGPLTISPRPGNDPGLFWAGASYEMEFRDSHPTPSYLTRAVLALQDWLKLPYRVVGQLAAIRPSSVDRKPFAGWHPVWRRAGLLNGMGSKGALHAPWLADAMARNILTGEALPSPTDVQRAARALERADRSRP